MREEPMVGLFSEQFLATLPLVPRRNNGMERPEADLLRQGVDGVSHRHRA